MQTSKRHTRVQATPLRVRRRRKGRWRRFVTLVVLLAVIALLARAYLLQVYAPGLRSEAREVPALVQAQLGQHGASYVPLSQISPNLQHAIVAVEDRRFYLHPGVDPVGMARALLINLSNQHIDQGGSTLEEQLVKRAIVGDDRTLHGKLRTMALAWAIDQDFTKQQALELYLNAAYYGQGSYGAEQAAQVYFGTNAADLTIAQAAFLAALPQAPSIYGAHPRSQMVLDRQKTVLQDMAASGYITAGQERSAEQAPLAFALPSP